MIIRRTISFDFLGDHYKDSYGIFASIPITEYPEIAKTIDAEKDNIKKTNLMLDLVRSKLQECKFANEKGELEDVSAADFAPDANLLLTIYNRLMGGSDPKVR